MKKKILLGMCVVAVMAGILGYFLWKENRVEGAAISPATFVNLIGTRTGSTTVGVGFYAAFGASSTYPFSLLGASEASIVFFIKDATSTGGTDAGVIVGILGSHDPMCNTATTTTSFNHLIKTEVQWFDAAPHILGSGNISSFVNGTTTLSWNNPKKGQLRELYLTDLNMNCLKVEISASSTVLYAQYKLN